jgi:hypothetical protein
MPGKTNIEEDDEQARRARAESLMHEIERLTSRSETDKKDGGDQKETDETETAPQRPLSPREFIHKRMRELDKGEKRGG